jgi:hypothetical protein
MLSHELEGVLACQVIGYVTHRQQRAEAFSGRQETDGRIGGGQKRSRADEADDQWDPRDYEIRTANALLDALTKRLKIHFYSFAPPRIRIRKHQMTRWFPGPLEVMEQPLLKSDLITGII